MAFGIISNWKYLGSCPAELHTDSNADQMLQYIGNFDCIKKTKYSLLGYIYIHFALTVICH